MKSFVKIILSTSAIVLLFQCASGQSSSERNIVFKRNNGEFICFINGVKVLGMVREKRSGEKTVVRWSPRENYFVLVEGIEADSPPRISVGYLNKNNVFRDLNIDINAFRERLPVQGIEPVFIGFDINFFPVFQLASFRYSVSEQGVKESSSPLIETSLVKEIVVK